MAILEEQIFLDEMKATYVETHLRVKRLEEEREVSAGCIVRKGPKKQYHYWQRYEKGKQVHTYLLPEQVDEVESKIFKAKENRAYLAELKRFRAKLQRMLASVGIHGADVLREYEEKQSRKEDELLMRMAAQEVAAGKRYAENYKYLTDRGEQVASKSELIIANILYAYGVKYEYERPFEIDGKVYKPDFTVWRPDGTLILWEHAGLMDDPEYAWNFQQKLRMYHIAGYIQSVNLIVTYENEKPFSSIEARRMVELYKLV